MASKATVERKGPPLLRAERGDSKGPADQVGTRGARALDHSARFRSSTALLALCPAPHASINLGKRTPQEESVPQLAFQSAFQSAHPPPAIVTAIRTAQKEEEEEQWEVVEEEAPPATSGSSAYAGLDPKWLLELQAVVEGRGFDVSSLKTMELLAQDAGLPDTLAASLVGRAGVTDVAIIKEMIRLWQEAMQRQFQFEQEAKKKRMRPLWRCRVCGRVDCSFAPYIEGYEEVDA